MSYPDSTGENLLVTMSPSEIREEIASALYNRRPAVINVVGAEGTRSISFRIRSTDHTPADNTLDLILGVTEDGRRVQVAVPTSGEPTLALRPPQTEE